MCYAPTTSQMLAVRLVPPVMSSCQQPGVGSLRWQKSKIEAVAVGYVGFMTKACYELE